MPACGSRCTPANGAGRPRSDARCDVRPERIAHGPGAVDDPALCAELIRRGVALDLCPTSNVQAGIVPTRADHPLAVLHRRGVAVTLSTDDRTVSDITLTDEYIAAVEEIGLTRAELWAIDRRALDVAFAASTDLAPLKAEFDAWAVGHAGELTGPAAARSALRSGLGRRRRGPRPHRDASCAR